MREAGRRDREVPGASHGLHSVRNEHVVHDDGTELELGPGNAYEIMPGHDAWVVGDERCIAFGFESRAAEEYARE